MSADFLTKLLGAAGKNDSWLCVGLDPIIDRLPDGLERKPAGIVEFCRRIIETTADCVCAYKPNIAFFESLGRDGWPVLKDVIDAVPEDIPVILDAKRGDIGHTSEHYAVACYEHLGVDAVTVNPYLGLDAVRPFMKWSGKAAFVLCLTSNATAADVQLLDVDGEPLYLHVARMVSDWEDGICGLVVGATRPELIGKVRAAAPRLPFLIPGIGAQGGDLRASVEFGSWGDGGGAIVNVSRSVLYASSGTDFADAARIEVEKLCAQMRGTETTE